MKLLVTWPLGAKGADWPNACVPYHLAIHEWCVRHDVPTMVLRGYLDENRNQALLLARREGFTHVAMLDGDHKHPPDTIERLWQHVQDDPKRMVVAGLNYQSAGINRPMIGVYAGGKRQTITRWETPLITVGWAALCACIVSVNVMDMWKAPWFWFSYDRKQRWTTEDINFCDKLHERGVTITVDTTLVAPHRTEMYADAGTWRRYQEWRPEGAPGSDDEDG